MQTLKDKMVNPLANHRLTVKAMQPTGHYCLVRIDPPKTETDSGLVLPDGSSMSGQFAGAAVGRGAAEFKFEMTAVIVKLGPDAEGIEVGDRILVTVPPVPVVVADASEEFPLGLFDSRDIVCRVA